jgi:hypothetical protein
MTHDRRTTRRSAINTRRLPVKKAAALSLLIVALVLVTVEWSEAHGWRRGGVRTSVVLGFGPAFWWGPPYPYWWYHPPYVYTPPAVIVQEPPVYIQQQPAPPPPQAFWYYCAPAKAYYPSAQTCPEAWIKVPAKTD